MCLDVSIRTIAVRLFALPKLGCDEPYTALERVGLGSGPMDQVAIDTSAITLKGIRTSKPRVQSSNHCIEYSNLLVNGQCTSVVLFDVERLPTH